MTTSLHKILDWKLLDGSHDFPGSDGGTCINEAAIVAAGFKYRKVGGVSDLPPCFSPVLGGILISLNDAMDNTDRQQLIEFVTKLPGSKDTLKVEKDRLCYIILHLNNFFYGTNYESYEILIKSVGWADSFIEHSDAEILSTARKLDSLKLIIDLVAEEIAVCYTTTNTSRMIEIMRGAFAIGKQATEIDIGLVQDRLAMAKNPKIEA